MQKNQLTSRKFFDRQMQIFGAEGQKAISQAWVFVRNLGGVHAELVKNLALLGFNLVLSDEALVSDSDLKTNLFFNADSVGFKGQRKDRIVREAVRELNPLINAEMIENIDEQRSLLSKCSLFLVYPRSFAEFEDYRKKLQSFEGTKIFTFCEFSSGWSFVEHYSLTKATTIELLDSKNHLHHDLRPKLLNDFFKHFHQSGLFEYNDEERIWFTFCGIYGSILSQVLLNCVLEGAPSFNLINYDTFGKEPDNLDGCTLATTSI